MRGLHRYIATLALFVLAACSGGAKGRPSGDPDLIRRDQMLAGSYPSAWEAVRSLHPNWLVKRNNNGSNSPTPIWVYVDGTRYGDVNWLRNVPASTVGSIRRIDGINATTRWGTGHTEGVLYITSYLP